MIAIEKVPPGAVVCPKCLEYSGFLLSYDAVHVTYSFAGLDKEHSVIYAVSKTSGPWAAGTKQAPRAVTCSSCKASMPSWILNFNGRYVK